jgi:small subunit ribosomal protein S7
MARKKKEVIIPEEVEESEEEFLDEPEEEFLEETEEEFLEETEENSEEETDSDAPETDAEEVDDSEDLADDLTSNILLFDRWSFRGVEVEDISLANYINLEPIIVPHSGGKHQHKKFWKTEHISIIERFINKLMTPGLVKKRIKGRGSSYNMGKKQQFITIIRNSFALMEARVKDNPIQILVDAIQNASPREETTRISLGGISYQQAVDIAPQRRVDLGLKILVQSIVAMAYNNVKTIDEIIAKELILAAKNDPNSRAVKRKDEIERMAVSAR